MRPRGESRSVNHTVATRETNAMIAAAYDRVPCDPAVADDALDPDRVLGLGAVYGAAGTRRGDVLDLGCGSGIQLARAAQQMQGRLVGVDLSAESCKMARIKLAPLGTRADIVHADFLDLAPETLGQFDFIYNIGVIFVVPPEVRNRIIQLIGKCLKPGGVAVLGYYAGSLDTLRGNLHRTLRSVVQEETDIAAAIALARAHLQMMKRTLRTSGPERAMLLAAIQQTEALPDAPFFHEALNQCFDAIQTTQIERMLAEHGTGFASYLGPSPFVELAGSRERAIAADAMDFSYSSYRYAAFVRWADARQSPDLRRDNIIWHSALKADSSAPQNGQAMVFRMPDGQSITVRGAVTIALLNILQDKPLTWHEAFSAARQSVAPSQALSNQEQVSLASFAALWRYNYVAPRICW